MKKIVIALLLIVPTSNSNALYRVQLKDQKLEQQEKIMIAGAVLATGALLYYGYRQHHKSTLHKAHEKLFAKIAQVNRLVEWYGTTELPDQINMSAVIAQKQKVDTDIATIEKIKKETMRQIASWQGYADFNSQLAQSFINDIESSLPIIKERQKYLAEIIAEDALQKSYSAYQTFFARLLRNKEYIPEFETQLKYVYQDKQYPYLACYQALGSAQNDLRQQESQINDLVYAKNSSMLLRGELEDLVKIVISLPNYTAEKQLKAKEDLEREKLANERLRIQTEQEKVKAERERAAAEHRRANAEERRAQAEKERAQVEREKLDHERLNTVLETFGLKEKPKPHVVNLHVHQRKSME